MSALVLTMAIGMRKGRGEPGTTVIRAIVSVWICAGISMRFLFPAMSLAGTPQTSWCWSRGAARSMEWPMPDLPELNPVIHGKLRLALLSLLSGVDEAEFTWLRSRTGSTDGNLGAQLMKLEEAGYVTVEKRFVQRKPQTLYRMTETGRAALTEYVQALKQLLGGAIVS